MERKNLEQWVKSFDDAWIQNKIDNDCLLWAEQLGKELAEEGMTNTQIRNFFGEVKKIQSHGYRPNEVEFLLLRPKLAYTSARFLDNEAHKKESKRKEAVIKNRQGVHKFAAVISEAHKAVETKDPEKAAKQFERFVDLIEAVLAYHRWNNKGKN